MNVSLGLHWGFTASSHHQQTSCMAASPLRFVAVRVFDVGLLCVITAYRPDFPLLGFGKVVITRVAVAAKPRIQQHTATSCDQSTSNRHNSRGLGPANSPQHHACCTPAMSSRPRTSEVLLGDPTGNVNWVLLSVDSDGRTEQCSRLPDCSMH